MCAEIISNPAGLLNVKSKDGRYLINNRELTGFSKAEDREVEKVVGSHFLTYYVEDELRSIHNIYR